MRNSKLKGFTLIELIVVIAIVGILAAILVPSMVSYLSSSKIATANSNAKLVHTNTAAYGTSCETVNNHFDQDSYLGMDLITSAEGYAKDGTELEAALRVMMGGSTNAGYASVAVDKSVSSPTAAAWNGTDGDGSDGIVGGYPVQATVKNDVDGVAGDVQCFMNDPANPKVVK